MITINLLPVKQIKQRARAKKEIVGLLAALVVFLCVLGLVAAQQSSSLASLRARGKRLSAEIKKHEKIVKQIKKIEKQRQALEEKLLAIEKLKNDSQLPVRILDEIARLTPPARMWFKTLTLNQKSVAVSGVAMDNATVARFMESVAASPYFLRAELKNSSMQLVAGQKLKAFSMVIEINHPRAAAAGEKAGKGKKAKKAKKT